MHRAFWFYFLTQKLDFAPFWFIATFVLFHLFLIQAQKLKYKHIFINRSYLNLHVNVLPSIVT